MADQIPTSLFEQIFGRAPTQDDRHRLLGIKSALGLSDRDELWPIIMTLDHYTRVNVSAKRQVLEAVDRLPTTIKTTVSNIESHAKAETDVATAAAIERGTDKLQRVIVRRAQETEDRISRRQMIVAASIGAVVALVCLAVGAGLGYYAAISLNDICSTDPVPSINQRVGCFID